MYDYINNYYNDRNSSINSSSSDDETSIIIVDSDDSVNESSVDNGYNTDTDDSINESGVDNGYNTDDGSEYDSIINEDYQHFHSEKEDRKYYLGLYHVYSNPNNMDTQLLLSTSVSAQTFFNHLYDNINNYLYYYGLVRIPNHEVQIMQVHMLNDDTCTVIIKTFWLRIIQRRWKQIYKLRTQMIRQRATPQNQMYSQIHGYYPNHIRIMPTLRDMMI
jgi:hypothetical protein